MQNAISGNASGRHPTMSTNGPQSRMALCSVEALGGWGVIDEIEVDVKIWLAIRDRQIR
jgi:hypothetical protein